MRARKAARVGWRRKWGAGRTRVRTRWPRSRQQPVISRSSQHYACNTATGQRSGAYDLVRVGDLLEVLERLDNGNLVIQRAGRQSRQRDEMQHRPSKVIVWSVGCRQRLDVGVQLRRRPSRQPPAPTTQPTNLTPREATLRLLQLRTILIVSVVGVSASERVYLTRTEEGAPARRPRRSIYLARPIPASPSFVIDHALLALS